MHALFKKMIELSSQVVTLTQQCLSMMKMAGVKICLISMKEDGAMLVQVLFPGAKKYVKYEYYS